MNGQRPGTIISSCSTRSSTLLGGTDGGHSVKVLFFITPEQLDQLNEAERKQVEDAVEKIAEGCKALAAVVNFKF